MQATFPLCCCPRCRCWSSWVNRVGGRFSNNGGALINSFLKKCGHDVAYPTKNAPRPPSSANPVKHSLSLLLFDAPMHDVRMYLCNTHTNTRKNISVWANDCATHYTSKWPLVHSCVPARPRKAQGSNENKYPPVWQCSSWCLRRYSGGNFCLDKALHM